MFEKPLRVSSRPAHALASPKRLDKEYDAAWAGSTKGAGSSDLARRVHSPARRTTAACVPDYTVDQAWDAYSEAEHELWPPALPAAGRRWWPRYACDEFNQALAVCDFSTGIPRFDAINRKLGPATSWQLVAVPGLVPDLTFFEHLANRRFPVTVWLRKPEEFDYIVEPDIFHDFFGHVPMLFNPVFADYIQAYGRGGIKAHALGAIEMLARLYWYTVEFGLIEGRGGLRTYGAGVPVLGREISYCIDSPNPNRIGFDLLRIMQTRYKIDTYQETYFVIRDFQRALRCDGAGFHSVLRPAPGARAHAPSAVLAHRQGLSPRPRAGARGLMTSFQASLLRGIVPLVLAERGAVYALDAWREFRTKEELSQRIVRRGAELVADRFDQVLSEARLGAQLLATSGPAGDLPSLIERSRRHARQRTTGPRRARRRGVGELADRLLPAQPPQYRRLRSSHPNSALPSSCARSGPEGLRNRIVNPAAWGGRALWLELDAARAARWPAPGRTATSMRAGGPGLPSRAFPRTRFAGPSPP
jgi:phenylalanine-4-hydroxylase